MSKERFTGGELSALCLELALLLHAGLGAADGLRVLQEDAAPERAALLASLAEETERGGPLSGALRNSGAFPDYLCALTACGERTGRLEESLRALSEYYDAQERLEREVRGALLFPSLLFLMMAAVIAVLLARVLPVFNEVLSSLGGEMTGLAGGLLALGGVLDTLMPALLVLLALAGAALLAFSASDRFRAAVLERWRGGARGDRGVARKVTTARLAQALAMGLRSGLPVEESLELAASFCPEAAGRRCRDCRSRLEQGAGLAEALRSSELLSAAHCRMLALGVRGGSADTVMAEIARRLEEESSAAIAQKTGRIEPALVLVTSAMVGVILLSVMLPLMNIMAAIG